MASHTMRNLSNLDDIQASSLYARQGGLPMHSDQPPCQPQGGRRQRRSLKLFPYIPDNPITGSSSTKFHASMPLAAPAKPLKSESSYTSDSAKPRNGGLSFVPPPLRIKSRFYNAHSALPPAVSEVNGTATFVRNPADVPKQPAEPAHDTPPQQSGSQQFERQSKPRISLQHPRRSIPNLLDLIEERKRVAHEQAVSQSSARPVTPVTPVRKAESRPVSRPSPSKQVEERVPKTPPNRQPAQVQAPSPHSTISDDLGPVSPSSSHRAGEDLVTALRTLKRDFRNSRVFPGNKPQQPTVRPPPARPGLLTYDETALLRSQLSPDDYFDAAEEPVIGYTSCKACRGCGICQIYATAMGIPAASTAHPAEEAIMHVFRAVASTFTPSLPSSPSLTRTDSRGFVGLDDASFAQARAMELESGGKVTAAEVIEVALHGTVWEAELRKVKAASWRDWEARVRDARERAAAREHSLWRRSSSIGLEGLKRAGREVRAAFRGS